MTAGGDEREIARRVLLTIPPQELKKSYGYQGQVFHYVSAADGLIVLCMAEQAFSNRAVFSFLQDVSNRFRGMYSVSSNAQELSMMDFARTLKERMHHYSNDPSSERVSKLKTEVEGIKEDMRGNIGKAIERGGAIEVVLEKTHLLEAQSTNLKHVSSDLKNEMWWKRKKCWCISILVLCIVLAGVIAGIVIAAKQ